MEKFLLRLGVISLSFFCIAHISWADCQNVKLIVVRHGNAEHILEGVRNSRLESPPKHLTKHGVQEIIKAANSLRKIGISFDQVEAMYSSPLARTLESAAVLLHYLRASDGIHIDKNKDKPAITDSRLDPGETAQLQKIVADDKHLIQTDNHIIERNMGKCEGHLFIDEAACINSDETWSGETYPEVEARSLAFLNSLKEHYCQENNLREKVILVSTHDIVFKFMTQHVTKGLGNCTKTGEFRILSLGGKD